MVRTVLIIVGALALVLFAALLLRSRDPRQLVASEGPEQQFGRLGCARCHGPGRPYSEAIKAARGKPAEELAAFIRNPQAQRPGTPMPSYESVLTPEQALALARWLQAPDNPMFR